MARKGLHVLILDDNPFMRELVRGIISRFPVTKVSEASDGLAALRLLTETRVDAVVCDIVMAPMDGIEFVRRLRAADLVDEERETRPLNPDTPVVMLTAHADAENVEAARAAGATSFLVKPVVPNLLNQRIRVVTDWQDPDNRFGTPVF